MCSALVEGCGHSRIDRLQQVLQDCLGTGRDVRLDGHARNKLRIARIVTDMLLLERNTRTIVRLPLLIEEAGFADVVETAAFDTLTGTIRLYRARRD